MKTPKATNKMHAKPCKQSFTNKQGIGSLPPPRKPLQAKRSQVCLVAADPSAQRFTFCGFSGKPMSLQVQRSGCQWQSSPVVQFSIRPRVPTQKLGRNSPGPEILNAQRMIKWSESFPWPGSASSSEIKQHQRPEDWGHNSLIPSPEPKQLDENCSQDPFPNTPNGLENRDGLRMAVLQAET